MFKRILHTTLTLARMLEDVVSDDSFQSTDLKKIELVNQFIPKFKKGDYVTLNIPSNIKGLEKVDGKYKGVITSDPMGVIVDLRNNTYGWINNFSYDVRLSGMMYSQSFEQTYLELDIQGNREAKIVEILK